MSLKSLENLIHRISRYAVLPSIFILFVMMLFMTVDVFGRYLLNRPIPGSIDFVTVMMVILVFPALGYVSSLDGHVRTDILFDRLSIRGKGYFDIINSLGSILFVGLMTWQLGARAWSIIQNPPGISTSYFQWPHLPFICVATAGSALMGIEVIIWFLHSVARAIGREKE
jgi:TRAP-type C4-dicarboxylate transport system permease small subunit